MDATQKKYLGAGLVALAVVFLLVAMFTSWWTVDVEVGGAQNEETVTPFEDGEAEQVMTGVFALLALLAGVAVLALLLGHVLDIEALAKFPLAWSVIGAGAVGLLAVVALIVTATSWPDEDRGQEFWGEDTFGGFTGFPVNLPDTVVTYAAGMGWWLELLGALAIVGGAVLTWMAAQETPPKKKTRTAKPAA